MSWSFKIAIATDCLAVLVAFYFLLADYLRQSSSSNGSLAVATLAMCGWIGLCFYLHSIGKTSIASTLAWLPAIPLLGYGLIVLLFIILKPDMK